MGKVGISLARPEILQGKKIMYALTRRTKENSNCLGLKGFTTCDHGNPYVGSHDVFMFYVREKFTDEEMLPLKNVTPNQAGIDNLMIWFFQNKLGYTVLNPCYILHVHHHHCVSIREKGRGKVRVNTASTTGLASFTNKLDI